MKNKVLSIVIQFKKKSKFTKFLCSGDSGSPCNERGRDDAITNCKNELYESLFLIRLIFYQKGSDLSN